MTVGDATRRLTRGRGRISERTVLLVASFGAFLAFLDATIVNVAFPSIQRSLPGSSISSLSWILNAYSIVFAAFLVVSGRLADLVGRRRAFTVGVLLFTLSSAVCAAAGSVGFLVGARMFQALGAAILVPASLALVVQAFPAARRSHAIGLWGASAALAAGLGPPVGGALVEAGGWRWAFLVNVPVGLAATWAGRSLLVESRAPGRRRRPDLRGAVLSALALGLLTLGLVKSGDWGWGSAQVWACLLASAAFFGGFVLSSRNHPTPLLDPTLLRIRAFAVGNLSSLVAGAGFYAYLLTNILWLQYVWGYSVFRAGMAVVPGALVAALLAAALGRVAETRGYRLVVVPGALVWALAYVWYATQVPVTPDFLATWLPGQILSGIGVGATLPVLGSAVLAAVPGGRFATASAVNTSARQVGATLGIAILVIIVGTPSATSTTTLVDGLRHAWVFSSVCFVMTAALAGLLGRVRVDLTAEEVDDGSLPSVLLPVAASPAVAAGAGVTTTGLLSRLPEDVRKQLEADATEVHLAAGEWLFREGDPADDFYLLVTGRLEVSTGSVQLRQLGAGAVIGELSLLTGGRRSASIRARRDSRLLRVSRGAFDSVVREDRAALDALATVLAEQIQDGAVPERSSRPPRPSVVAVVGLVPEAPVAAVAEALRGALERFVEVLRLDAATPDGLERAEAEHERVMLVATDPEGEWWRRCVRQADHLVLVAPADTPPPAEPPLGRTGADVVLVGPRPATGAQVRAWAAATDAWAVTSTQSPPGVGDLRRLAARIGGGSVGVVMAGGGARAFAHIGVLHELSAAGIEVDRVAGASLGAVVAALWASGHSAQEVEDICYEELVRRRPFSDYTLPVASVAKGRRLEHALHRRFGNLAIEELPRRFACTSTDLQARTVHDMRRGRVVDALLASVSLPVLFPPRRDGPRLLSDGGILDNLPVRLLTDRDEGPVLAVNIGTGGSPTRPASGDTSETAGTVRVPTLGETLMRTIFIGSGRALAQAQAAGAVVVTPSTRGVGLLEFHQLDRMVESGRAAARAVLDQAPRFLS
ncbi:MAG TPA: DHA2 family efflux MFS transporter permease subunit [Actinomycetes bacterium]|nr:DHA2 family efflux MFS transporter permease subunit [Actinomycetes bacterium]